MRKTKAKIAFMLALVLVLLAACSSKGESGSEAKPPASAANPSKQAAEPDKPVERPDPFGKYEEPVTLEIAYFSTNNSKWPEGSNDSFKDNEFTRYYKDKLNMEFEFPFEVPQTGYDEKINLLIASNDIPDFTFVTESQFKILAESDVLMDLSQIVEDYASPLLKEVINGYGPQLLNRITYDGKLLGIPSSNPAHNEDGVVWIRTDWLNNVGLELPKIITVDDLEKAARAFVEQDPDRNGKKDTYGVQSTSNFISSTVGYNTLDLVFTAYQAMPRIWTRDEAGKIVYGSTRPEMKQALAKLRDWYASGLLDPEFGTVQPNQYQKDVSAGKAGIVMGYTWITSSALKDSVVNDPQAEWNAYILAADDGKFYARQPNPLGKIMVVKKGTKHPEAIVKAINVVVQGDNDKPGSPTFYTDSPGTIWTVRPIQQTFRGNDVVRDRFQRLNDAANGKLKPDELSDRDRPLYDNYIKGLDALKKESPGDYAYILYQFLGGETVLNPINTPVYNEFYGITESMGLKWANLIKLENESFVRIIVGEKELDYFDTFVSEWNKQGGQEITAEVQAEVDRMNG